MEVQWIGIAFLLGLLARRLGQPPLLGFLAAGFGLELLGLRPDASLRELADVGILLLLFAIGLKLDLRSLASRAVLATSLVHMALISATCAGLLGLGMWLEVGLLAELSPVGVGVVAFALCFSSTVFAVKVLEERDDMSTVYGRVAIGILIMQDIAAVLFIVISKGEWPSPWAVFLLALVPARPLIGRALNWCGHGELLALAGLAAALGAAALFEAVGLKADLGALVAGVLCGGHEKSRELAKSLLSLKEVFLVGFFLSVGLTGWPTEAMVWTAILIAVALPLKSGLFFLLLARSRLRVRSALLSTAALSSYSEFGLIVAAVAAARGWLPSSWAVTLALAVGFSFVLGATFNGRVLALYRRARARLARFETAERVEGEEPVDVGWARALVFGLGRVGTPAYDFVRETMGDEVVGFDVDERRVAGHAAAGRRVYVASATDADFWERLHLDRERVELVLLAMSSHDENRVAIEQLRAEGYRGTIAATALHDDEVSTLSAAGADLVFRTLADAGPAFAAQALARSKPSWAGPPRALAHNDKASE